MEELEHKHKFVKAEGTAMVRALALRLVLNLNLLRSFALPLRGNRPLGGGEANTSLELYQALK